jgi:hypothetical protein
MVSRNDFTLNSVQTAVFTQDQSAFVAGKALAAVLEKFSQRYDGQMQVLPLPLNAPLEIPHVSLQSSDGKWRLNMGPSRLDSFWTNLPFTITPLSLESVAQECAEVQDHYLGKRQAQVGRLALIVSRICPVERPAETLIQHFCNERSQQQPFRHSATFEVHNHKVYTPEKEGIDYQVNSWVRCKTTSLVADNRPVILVEQDLNTLEKPPHLFDDSQIRAFFRMAVHEADEILRVYFPGDQQ